MKLLRALALAALVTPAPPARAQPENSGARSRPESPPQNAVRPRSYQLDFQAGRVEADTNLDRIELSDNVVVRVDRYRLTSDRLRLRRGPLGIIVDGDGRVAFCPCPDPPVSIGFSSATAAPPTDLLIENPTLRVGSVPIAWLPYLWLRSPDRFGVLPPKLAWRGDDGLLAGSGVHVPIGKRTADAGPALLDLRGAGYFKGGAEVELDLATSESTTKLRWDHLGESLVAADAHGAANATTGATAAWRIDAIRGERGRLGTIELEPASRREDRALLSVGRGFGGLVGGLGVSATGARAGAFDDPGAVGPEAHLGIAGALGEVGRASASVSATTTTHRTLSTFSNARQRAELGLDARPGPLSLGTVLREDAWFESGEQEAGRAALVGAEARAGLPLVRGYGEQRDPLLHELEPFVAARGALSTEKGPLIEPPLFGDDNLLSLSAGGRTALGRYGSRSAVSLVASGGLVGESDDLEPMARARLTGRTRLLAISSDVAWLLGDERTLVATGKARVGRADGLRLSGYAEGRLEVEPTLARFLAEDAWDAPRVGFFERPGWSAGGELGVPWFDWLASAFASDWDVSEGELLAVRGSLGYRHRCGCLAALAWVGHRQGREGVDAWLTLDLLP